MRLVSYGAMGSERAGMLIDNAIIDLPVSDMRLFLEQPDWRRQLDRIFAARSSAKAIERKSVRLGAPVPVPRKLLIAGANTKSHLAQAGPVLEDIAPPRSPSTRQIPSTACTSSARATTRSARPGPPSSLWTNSSGASRSGCAPR